jgi:triose/dihydroxyacetone kinase / FAD-AMP lyase (cyclizing)
VGIVGTILTNAFPVDLDQAKRALASGLNKVIVAEPDITAYDSKVGDGDCGIGLKRGAEAILRLLEQPKTTDDAVAFLNRIIHVVETNMDGTSGALYAIFLNALAYGLRSQSPPSPSSVTAEQWAKALKSSLLALEKYTPAKPGDRTLMDALYPFVETFSKTGSVKQAAEEAENGARATKGMKASLGRTVYIGGGSYKEVPDPGAYGLAQFLLGIAEGL